MQTAKSRGRRRRAALALLALLLLLPSCGSLPQGQDFDATRQRSVAGLRFLGQETRRLLGKRTQSIRDLGGLSRTSSGASARSLSPPEFARLGAMWRSYQRLSYREQAR